MAYLGVIEGFYGRSWSHAQRRELAVFLQRCGYNFYIYAPKEDRALRCRSFPAHYPGGSAALQELCACCHSRGLDFGLALSPLGLTADYPARRGAFLGYAACLQREVQPDIFCLLFDDMHLETADAGARQRRIIEDLAAAISPQLLIVCPTYYSFDPILERVFGQRPEHYFAQLLQGLDQRIAVFWTGPRVLSADLTAEDLCRAAELLGRKPFIWDNYPVNDGRRSSNFLHLRPFTGRAGLAQHAAGHAANPMLEFNLSQLALRSLPLIYRGLGAAAVEQAWQRDLRQCLSSCEDPEEVCRLVSECGRQALDAGQLAYLRGQLQRSNACEEELLDFLDGAYAFDPACLTDSEA